MATVLVRGCARCGASHEIEWRRFVRPIDEWTHWALCPTTGEPILMKIVEEEARSV